AGRCIKAARENPAKEPGSGGVNLPGTHSNRIAARRPRPPTQPGYIPLGGESVRKAEAVPQLIQAPLSQLNDLEALTREGVPPGSDGGWNNPEGFRQQAGQLLSRVQASRKLYGEMLAKAKSELSARDASSQ